MPLQLDDFSEGKDIFFTESFKVMVRSEREFIIRESSEAPISSRSQLFAFRYDIYRLLRVMNVPSYLWWVTAYINGIEDPSSDITHLQSIRKVNESALSARIARSNTTAA